MPSIEADDDSVPDASEVEEEEEEDDEDSDAEYEVEAITKFRRDPADSRVTQLSTKWRGYPLTHNTWEAELDLIHEGAADTVYAFWTSRGGRNAALRLDHRRGPYVAYRILRRVESAAVPTVLVQWLG